MVWLVTHIWLSIAIAALLGLILGWALRGIRFSGGARRAMVERDIALTELGQVRGELDSLYAAQRTGEAAQPSAGGALQADFAAQAEKLESLEAQLAASRTELEDVKADSKKKLLAATAAAAAVAGTGAAVVAGRADDSETPQKLDAGVNAGHAQVEWRNRYLESRVRSLETSLSNQSETPDVEEPPVEDQSERVTELEMQTDTLERQIKDLESQLEEANSKEHSVVAGVAGAAAGAGAVIAGQAAAQDDATSAEPVDTTDLDKMTWQNEYLRQRIAFMEENGLGERAQDAQDGQDANESEAVAPVLAPEPVESEPVEPEPVEEVSPEAEAETADIEQELARLRWRNRYLEGRLAYIDGDASPDGGDEAKAADDEQKVSAAEALLERLEKSGGGET